jgi:DNA-binding CsgD family transcriptional regulator
MLRRLDHVAHPFARSATVAETIDKLDAVVSSHSEIRVNAVWPRHAGQASERLIFSAATPRAFQDDCRRELAARGPSVVARAADANPPPFTFGEALRRLQPTGEDRWIFDLFRDYGMRDALYCPYGTWLVTFSSTRPFTPATLPVDRRIALDAAGAMAVHRLKELELSARSPRPSLSPREKTALLHLSDGLTVVEIAARLGVASSTVRATVSRAERKLGARSQLHAVAIAIRLRLI